ncbi:MAG TPA: sugar ABC transporter permease [Thermomicrobiales bacterium]|nr:sugar ABC transporter permease [Thermomicrobiales bacterium]
MQQATTFERVRASEGTRGGRVRAHLRKNALPYLLILPSIVFLAAVEFYPLARGILEGFRYHNRVQPWATRYNGLDNFRKAYESHDVRLALRNSVVIVGGIVVASYLVGLVAGLILNQQALRFRNIYRALILIPWVTPPIAAYISWQWMLNDFGIVNRVLYHLGLVSEIEPIIFLGEPKLAVASVIMVGTWFRFPFMMITILAALSAIPDDLYEAAALDGANPIQSFRDITLPLIVPVSVIATLLQAIWTFNDFGLTYVLTGGGPANATLTLILLAYREAFQRPNIGFGTSLAIISMVLMLGLGAVYLRLQSRYSAPA